MKKNKKIKIAIISIISIIVAMILGSLISFSFYYHAENVDEYITSSSSVEVSEISNAYYFDGSGTDKALIFYPGAKVEAKAYAPLMNELAQNGIDCFLLKMPLNFAYLGMNRADEIMSYYDYDYWYMAGHSLGGVVASSYLEKHQNKFSALFLLGAYSISDLTSFEKPVVAIYGSEDLVLNLNKLENSKTNMPKTFFTSVIVGGNHSGFGSYGFQKGDGQATISNEKQWKQTVNCIVNTINENTQ